MRPLGHNCRRKLLDLLFDAAAFVFLAGALLAGRYGRSRPALAEFDRYTMLAWYLALLVPLAIIGSVASDWPLAGLVLALLALTWALVWLPERERIIAPRASIRIGRAPEEVASVMFDPARLSQWIAEITSSRLEGGGDLAVGSLVWEELQLPRGQRLQARLRVAEYRAGRRLELHLVEVPGHDLYTITPVDGGSQVTSEGSIPTPYVTALFKGWRQHAVQDQFSGLRRANLQRLKEIVEGAPMLVR